MNKKLNMRTIGNWFKKHAPELTLGAGVVGLLSSNVLTALATVKAVRKNDEVEVELGRKTTKKEKVKYLWKYYAAPASTAAVGTGAVLYADRMNLKKNAAAMSAYAFEKVAFSDYREKVKEKLDEKTLKKIDTEYQNEQIQKMDEIQPMKYDPDIPMGDKMYCYDTLFGVKFIASISDIERAANAVNKDTCLMMNTELDTFYDALNIPYKDRPEVSKMLGWAVGTELEVYHNKAVMKDGIPRLVIEYNIPPTYDYR